MLPGQLWGRVVRPPSVGATLRAVDDAAVRALAEVVAVVRDGSFLGVVATAERAADLAAERLRAAAEWEESPTLPDEDDLAGYLRAGPHTDFAVDESGTDVDVAVSLSASLLPAVPRARLHLPQLRRRAVGRRRGARVELQPGGVRPAEGDLPWRSDLAPAAVVVEHVEGAGSYGHNGADDAAFDAVLLARAVPGRPVHVRWSRADELSWSPFGSPMVVDVTAGLDAAGRLVSWESDVWSQGHTSRPGFADSPGLLAAAHLARPHPLPAPGRPAAGARCRAAPATRSPATPCRAAGSPGTGCSRSPCARPRSARSAPSPTCSRSSR